MPRWMLDPMLEPPCAYLELPELCCGSRGFGQLSTPLDELDQDSCLAPWFVLGWSWAVLLCGTVPRTLLLFLTLLLPHGSAGWVRALLFFNI